MDLSDSLLGDAGKLAYASGLGATLEMRKLPVPSALARRVDSDTAQLMAADGGEDYELLIAASADVIERAQTLLAERGLSPLSVVGRLHHGDPGSITLLGVVGRPVAPPRVSWDHFRRESGA